MGSLFKVFKYAENWSSSRKAKPKLQNNTFFKGLEIFLRKLPNTSLFYFLFIGMVFIVFKESSKNPLPYVKLMEQQEI